MRWRRWLASFMFLIVLIGADATAQMARIKVGYSSIGVGQSLVWV